MKRCACNAEGLLLGAKSGKTAGMKGNIAANAAETIKRQTKAIRYRRPFDSEHYFLRTQTVPFPYF
jgi:hypothetical protein